MLNNEKASVDLASYNKDKIVKCNDKFGLLLDDYIYEDDIKLFRLVAFRDDERRERFKCGDLGGYISGKDNLSDDDSSWVDYTSKVVGKAVVSDNSYVCKNSIIRGNASLRNNVIVEDNCEITDTSIRDNVIIRSDCYITSRCPIKNNVKILNGVTIDNSIIYENVTISGDIYIHDCCKIFNNVKIQSNGFDLLEISNRCVISDGVNLRLSGVITDKVIIKSDINIKSISQKVYLADITLPSEMEVEDAENLLTFRKLLNGIDVVAYKSIYGELYLSIGDDFFTISNLKKAINNSDKSYGKDLLLSLINFLELRFAQ